MPVGLLDTHTFAVPTFDVAYRCRDTAVTTVVHNTGPGPLTLHAHWRLAASPDACDERRFPVQIAGLPAGASLVLDGITGRYWAELGGERRRPAYIVGTPSGAPWQPPVIDRSRQWELVAVAPSDALFEIDIRLADREA